MRTWYKALEEDYKICLIEISKNQKGSISPKTLKKYRENEDFIPRPQDKDRLVAMVRTEISHFNVKKLEEYLNKEHAQTPVDFTRRRQIKAIKDSIDECKTVGIDFDQLVNGQPLDETELPEWIYDVMQSSDGIHSMTPFLETIRMDIEGSIEGTTFNAVKALHDAIAPLIIVSADCVDKARGQVSSMKGVNEGNGPGMAALSIGRAKGVPYNIDFEEVDNVFKIKTPNNAMVVKSFDAEGDLLEQIGRKIHEKRPFMQIESSKLTEDDYEKIEGIARVNQAKNHPLFIYLGNEVSNYPVEQLGQVEKLLHFHKFASNANNEVDILRNKDAVLWLLTMYKDLYDIEARIIQKVRDKVLSIKNIDNNEALTRLQNEIKNAQTDTDVLNKVEKFSSIIANTTDIAANLPDALENCSSVYDKAKTILMWLIENANAIGGGA